MKLWGVLLLSLYLVFMTENVYSQGDQFDFKNYLFDELKTLYVFTPSINSTTGDVEINGVDIRNLIGPFTWEWGDGEITYGWFPQTHQFADKTKNYVVKVTSHYEANKEDSAETIVWFPHLLFP
jgi:hypothetical protein